MTWISFLKYIHDSMVYQISGKLIGELFLMFLQFYVY